MGAAPQAIPMTSLSMNFGRSPPTESEKVPYFVKAHTARIERLAKYDRRLSQHSMLTK